MSADVGTRPDRGAARDAAAARDWHRAALIWAAIHADDPADREAALECGRAQLEGGNHPAAEAMLAGLAGEHHEAAVLHARAAQERGDHVEALRRWDHVRVLDPAQAIGYASAATVLWKLERIREAEELLLQGRALVPENGLMESLAWSASLRNDWEEAIRRWEVVGAVLPDEVSVQVCIGRALIALDRYAEWEQRILPVVKRHPDRTDLLAQLAQVGSISADQRFEAAPPVMAALCEKFESLGDGCEFGLVQRHFGTEPLSLLRWTVIDAPNLARALAARFDGLGDDVTVEAVEGAYWLTDRRTALVMNTFVPTQDVPEDVFIPRMQRRLKFLADKLLDDLADGEKVFVHKANWGPVTVEEQAMIIAAVRRIGPGRLLFVMADPARQDDTLFEEIAPGIALGYLDRVSPTAHFAEISYAAWGRLLERAAAHWRLLEPSGDADSHMRPAAVSEDAAEVARSPWFDAAFYSLEAGRIGTPGALAAHYLGSGEARLLRPSAVFDPRFYRAYYPDVVEHGLSPILHYIRHGRHERRYASHAQLRADAALVAASGLFDPRVYSRKRGRAALPGLTDIEDYLINRAHEVPIGDKFDSAFYASLYPDVGETRATPLLHYLDLGQIEHRVPNRVELERRRAAFGLHFDADFYLGQLPAGMAPGDPLDHYIAYGSRAGYDPSPDFSTDYYLGHYADVARAGLDPFDHFVLNGTVEDRRGRPDFSRMLVMGEQGFDMSKPTILVTSHEADRSGAPLVALNIGSRLAASHNIIFHIARPGPVQEAFRKQCCLMAVGAMSPLDTEYLLRRLKETHRLGAVLINSVETNLFGPAALFADLPSVALIHEFSEYTNPQGRMSSVAESADRVIVPAALIRDSLQGELRRVRCGPASNVMVRPQGCLPELPPGEAGTDYTHEQLLALTGVAAGEDVRFVLGAGFVHMRKGVDLFVQTAAEVRRLHGPAVRFIWVGAGYYPSSDLHYSAWVADMVRRLGLKDTVFFLPVQGSLDTLFALADVFYLPSRLDPFPNVVLDALKAGRSVVCFEGATGSAELFAPDPGNLGQAVGAAVPYCDTAAAAAALVRAFAPAEIRRAGMNAMLAETRFSFAAYLAVLEEQLAGARAERAVLVDAVRRIEQGGQFDAEFHDGISGPPGTRQVGRAIRAYAARGLKGLMLFNPRPGFCEGIARMAGHAGPALGAAGAPAQTHRCITLDERMRPAPFAGPVAVHLHLHYPELAASLCAELVAAGGKADLIVTATSEIGRLEVAYALRGYKGGSVRVLEVPNRGRDIGPFLTEVVPLVRAGGYQLIGHLHGKRSIGVEDSPGDRWRAFLIGTLLGGRSGLAGALAPFTADPALGLLFPEDRHICGWTENHGAAEALAARMQPAPVLPAWPVFPLGSMFWARPAALEPLWQLNLTLAEFPPEPIRNDGTILHAIERLLPAICEAAGFGWSTLYRKGAAW